MLTTVDGGMLVTLLAKLGNLSRSGVRFLEDKGILKPRYNESGYRVFAAEDFMRLRLFQSLRAAGLSQKESLEAAALQPHERQDALRATKERLIREHEQRMRLIDAELAKTGQAECDDAPAIVERPAFLALPDCGTFLDSSPSAQKGPDSAEVVQEGIKWWSREPDVSFGLLFSAGSEGDIDVGRYALMEVAADGPPSNLPPGVAFLAPRTCLRIVTKKSSDTEPEPFPGLSSEIKRAASAVGVATTLDGAVARETYLQFKGDRLTVYSEIWLPIAE